MTRRILLSGFAIALSGWGALSGQTMLHYQLAGAPDIGIEGFSSQVVTGKPFSAVEERHSLQILGDGTRIETAETNRLYRDDRGRTRVERTGGVFTIFDPVAGFTAELNPATKVVSRTGILAATQREAVNNAAVSALRAKIETLRRQSQNAQSPAEEDKLKAELANLERTLGAQSAPNRVFYNSSATGGGELTVPLSSFSFSGMRQPSLNPATGNNWSLEYLPAQTVNGAMAQGTRTTETIPAGKIGNDRPIVIVNERWSSDDLQLLVKSTSFDPRFGDTTYQLTNIVQVPPDPSLFVIPADYTVPEKKNTFRFTTGRTF
jgi:hypothetical protein